MNYCAGHLNPSDLRGRSSISGGTIINANHVGDAPTTIFTTCTRPALGMTEAQPAYHFSAQLTSRHRVDRSVDGFVGSLEGGGVGMHGCQCASNLFRRVTNFQILGHLLPKCSAGCNLRGYAWLNSASVCTALRRISLYPPDNKSQPTLRGSFGRVHPLRFNSRILNCV